MILDRRSALLAAGAATAAWTTTAAAPADAVAGIAPPGQGVVVARSARPFAATIDLLKRDIAAKKIMFFGMIDQAKLAAGAGIALRPSTLLLFGNPPLGIQFLTANPWAGLDWPVRLLVTQDEAGNVWLAYSDFAWIARRHGITDRDAAFAMAATVVTSILSRDS